MAADLIDPAINTCDEDLVTQMFLQEDAKVILQIPTEEHT